MNKFLILVTSLLILGCNTIKKEPSENTISDFMSYIIDNDVEKVKEMLKKYLNLEDYHGSFKSGNYKPLSIAAMYGHEEIMVLLIDEGAEINKLDEAGEFPLYHSIYSGEVNTVKILIDNGADVNFKTKRGMTSLHYASFAGHLDIIELLFDNGAKQSYANDGVDSVIEAINGHNLEVLKYLNEKGYNFNYKDIDGISPILCAILPENDDDIVRFLIEIGVELNVVTNDNSPILHYDMYQNNGKYLELFLNNGADPNMNPDSNYSLLHIATYYSSLDKVKLLLDHGANPNLQDKTGRTPLDYAKELPEDETSKKIVSLLEEAMES